MKIDSTPVPPIVPVTDKPAGAQLTNVEALKTKKTNKYLAPGIVGFLQFLGSSLIAIGAISFILLYAAKRYDEPVTPIFEILGIYLGGALSCFVFSSIIDFLARSCAHLENINSRLESPDR